MSNIINTSWYNKNRAVQLTDIVGQDKIVNFLKKQAQNNNFSHAYLFSGQFGSGKTSMARILASLILCPNRKKHLVCSTCNVCVSIHNGHCVDVYEIDAASQRGIDDAKKIRETSFYMPQELKKKIYIIDECHMLTNEAWNALLKTIEEPSPYVVFIFCTTNHKKIPPTILSRCQCFVFNALSNSDIIVHLKKIANKEKVKIDDISLLDIAKISKGSMRDAINYLEQLSILFNNKITPEDTLHYFGLPNDNIIYKIIQDMINNDASGLLEKINVLINAGIDAKFILNDVIQIIRNIFVYQICGGNSSLLSVLEHEKSIIAQFSQKTNKINLIKAVMALGKINKNIELSINDRWLLEATLLNCMLIICNQI